MRESDSDKIPEVKEFPGTINQFKLDLFSV